MQSFITSSLQVPNRPQNDIRPHVSSWFWLRASVSGHRAVIMLLLVSVNKDPSLHPHPHVGFTSRAPQVLRQEQPLVVSSYVAQVHHQVECSSRVELSFENLGNFVQAIRQYPRQQVFFYIYSYVYFIFIPWTLLYLLDFDRMFQFEYDNIREYMNIY